MNCPKIWVVVDWGERLLGTGRFGVWMGCALFALSVGFLLNFPWVSGYALGFVEEQF